MYVYTYVYDVYKCMNICTYVRTYIHYMYAYTVCRFTYTHLSMNVFLYILICFHALLVLPLKAKSLSEIEQCSLTDYIASDFISFYCR